MGIDTLRSISLRAFHVLESSLLYAPKMLIRSPRLFFDSTLGLGLLGIDVIEEEPVTPPSIISEKSILSPMEKVETSVFVNALHSLTYIHKHYHRASTTLSFAIVSSPLLVPQAAFGQFRAILYCIDKPALRPQRTPSTYKPEERHH